MYHLACSCDSSYLPYYQVLLKNIIAKINSTPPSSAFPNHPLHFHLLCSSPLSKQQESTLKELINNLAKIYPCHLSLYLLTLDWLTSLNLPKLNGNYSTYGRIFLPQYLEGVETCLYLDIDMHVFCDIRELFQIPLTNANKEPIPLGAVPDFARYANRKLRPIDAKKGHKPITLTKDYFNAGLLLLNIALLQTSTYQKDALAIMQNYALPFHDQDVLNALFLDSYLKLSFEYNFIAQAFGGALCIDQSRHYHIHHNKQTFKIIKENPKIIHYASEKPWQRTISYQHKGQFITQYWQEYASSLPPSPKPPLEHYLGALILNARFWRSLLMPFWLLKAKNAPPPQDFDLSSLEHPNQSYELGKLALRLMHANKKPQYLILLIRILRAKWRLNQSS